MSHAFSIKLDTFCVLKLHATRQKQELCPVQNTKLPLLAEMCARTKTKKLNQDASSKCTVFIQAHLECYQ